MKIFNFKNMIPGKCKKRPPLRTFTEFAEEFGVSSQKLSVMLGRGGSPKPELTNNSRHKFNTWYVVKEMRDWWATQPESKKVSA